MRHPFLASVCALAICSAAASAQAHGIVGDRFFPATLAIDDPAVADELTLPQVSRFNDGDGWATTESAEFSKRLTKDFGLSFEGAYVDTDHGPEGLDNFGVSAKYMAYTSAPHEIMLSLGVDADIGRSGARDIGEDFSTVTPGIFFGKGFGDLPDSVSYLKPLAITGVAGVGFPSDRHAGIDTNYDDLTYGLTVQYSLPYLQQHVKDMGWGAPFNRLIPLVEFTFDTPFGPDKTTTGTANPGFIWAGQHEQFGLEAQLPLNSASGHGVGFLAQLHFYLDDLYPDTIGKPLF